MHSNFADAAGVQFDNMKILKEVEYYYTQTQDKNVKDF